MLIMLNVRDGQANELVTYLATIILELGDLMFCAVFTMKMDCAASRASMLSV